MGFLQPEIDPTKCGRQNVKKEDIKKQGLLKPEIAKQKRNCGNNLLIAERYVQKTIKLKNDKGGYMDHEFYEIKKLCKHFSRLYGYVTHLGLNFR